MTFKQTVYTYCTRHNGEVVGKDALDKALSEPHTFVQDILQTPFDGGSLSGGVVTTVLLITAPGYENTYSNIHKSA